MKTVKYLQKFNIQHAEQAEVCEVWEMSEVCLNCVITSPEHKHCDKFNFFCGSK